MTTTPTIPTDQMNDIITKERQIKNIKLDGKWIEVWYEDGEAEPPAYDECMKAYELENSIEDADLYEHVYNHGRKGLMVYRAAGRVCVELPPSPTEKMRNNTTMTTETTTEKHLGKIRTAHFGIGGYQDAMLGVFFSFEFDGGGISASKSTWDCNLITPGEHHQWTEDDRTKTYADIMRYVSDLLRDAKVNHFDQLKGKPVEVTIEGNTLKSWRILKEVL